MSLYVIAGIITFCVGVIVMLVSLQLEDVPSDMEEVVSVIGAIGLFAVIWPIPVIFGTLYGISWLIAKLIKTIG